MKKQKQKCKSKKAEINMVGVLLIAFVAIVVGIAIFQAIASSIGTATSTATLSNGLYTAPAVGSCIDLVGQELLSTPVVTNRTTGTEVPAVNYTIAERVSPTTGTKRIAFCTVGQDQGPITAINVSYTYGPEGYIDNAGGRSMAGLVLIFAALAIAIVALTPTLRSGLLDMMR